MRRPSELIPPHMQGFAAANVVCHPLNALSVAAGRHQSTPGNPHPLRTMDILGIPDFFDHAGNLINGSVPALMVTVVGTAAIEIVRHESAKKKAVITATAAGAILPTAINVAYEAGAPMPLAETKPDGAPFDGYDALYGSTAAILTSAAFCAASLLVIAKRKRMQNRSLAQLPSKTYSRAYNPPKKHKICHTVRH